jgi:ribosomal protein S18 acetylase RimI-like enzyme
MTEVNIMPLDNNAIHNELFVAGSLIDFQSFVGLVREYVSWCRDCYHDDLWFVEQAFGHQSLEAELETLDVKYSPPNGKTLLFREGGVVGGSCAYRVLPDGTCEMKRFFVSKAFRGRGIGRQLCKAIIALAKADGFGLMRLDTAKRFTEAQAIYTAFGFKECKPHLEYPSELMPFITFMELALTHDKHTGSK